MKQDHGHGAFLEICSFRFCYLSIRGRLKNLNFKFLEIQTLMKGQYHIRCKKKSHYPMQQDVNEGPMSYQKLWDLENRKITFC